MTDGGRRVFLDVAESRTGRVLVIVAAPAAQVGPWGPVRAT
ncbi:hypothetical protein [Streptomyces sp. NPDC048256]